MRLSEGDDEVPIAALAELAAERASAKVKVLGCKWGGERMRAHAPLALACAKRSNMCSSLARALSALCRIEPTGERKSGRGARVLLLLAGAGKELPVHSESEPHVCASLSHTH